MDDTSKDRAPNKRASEVAKSQLLVQLGHAVTMAAKQDQIVWTIFGVFWAANGAMLVSLLGGSEPPRRPAALIVSAAGVVLSCVWVIIQRRAIGWLCFYENVVRELEENHIKIPATIALSGGLNTVNFDEAVGHGVRVRPIMNGSGVVLALFWAAAFWWYCCRVVV